MKSGRIDADSISNLLTCLTEPEYTGLSRAEAEKLSFQVFVHAQNRYNLPNTSCCPLVFLWYGCGVGVDVCTSVENTHESCGWYVRVHLWRPWPWQDITVLFERRDSDECWLFVNRALGKFFKLRWVGFRFYVLAVDLVVRFRYTCYARAVVRGPLYRDSFISKVLNLLGGRQ